MPERHTVDFTRGSVALVSDDEAGTITLQYDASIESPRHFDRLVRSIRGKFGPGLASRIGRWRVGDATPFAFPAGVQPHPDAPEILCLTLIVQPGVRVDFALVTLIEFLRQQPGYLRTIGSPLDPDLLMSEVKSRPAGEISDAATAVLWEMMRRRRR